MEVSFHSLIVCLCARHCEGGGENSYRAGLIVMFPIVPIVGRAYVSFPLSL